MKDDPIFDKYLEKEDDGKHAREKQLNSDIDLALQSWNRVDYARTVWIYSSTLVRPKRTA